MDTVQLACQRCGLVSADCEFVESRSCFAVWVLCRDCQNTWHRYTLSRSEWRDHAQATARLAAIVQAGEWALADEAVCEVLAAQQAMCKFAESWFKDGTAEKVER
jgi:negative regulator of sigma E activity